MVVADNTSKINDAKSDHFSALDSIQDQNLIHYLRTWQPMSYRKAISFPSFMYTSQEVYKLERELFFSKTWIYVGHISQLSGANSYFTTSIAEIPLLIVMDKQGVLRAFHNVCPHRAAPVAIGSGQCNRFVCPYHAWTFDLEGNLRGIPNFEEYEDFNPENHGLTPIHVDRWGSFIFVNMANNCEPFQAQLNELPDLFNDYRLEEWHRVHSIDYYTDTNWKLYVENNAENYHEPIVHKSSYSTNEVSWNNSYDLIQCEARHHYYLQHTPHPQDLSGENSATYGFKPELIQPNLPQRLMARSSIVSFWPNFAWIACPESIIVYTIDPQSVSRTRIRWEWLVPNTEAARSPENLERLITLYDRVQQEDMNLLPLVQKGVESPGYVAGPFSPSREVGVHRFQELLMEHLSGQR
jgi:phenylpropionate dioxygenase-like ring-hydroxylating dioxygenase large terminal subunit